MKQMKYIIFEGRLHAEPLIFTTTQEHAELARVMEPTLGKPVSAGFLDLTLGEVSAYGRSDSLDIESRPEDSLIINKLIGG